MLQGLGELLFFSLEHPLDVALLLLEFREGIAHLGNQCGHDLVEEAAGSAQLVTWEDLLLAVVVTLFSN